MSKTLYVTSFNKPMFEATGKRMVMSFINAGVEGDLLITYEQEIAEEIPKADSILLFDLDSDEFLLGWLEANKDVILEEFGGEFKGCDCDKLNSSEHHMLNHVKYCPAMAFNKRACFWFRKIAAMREAMRIAKEDNRYDRVVFIDSDVVFKRGIPEQYMDSVFKGAGFFFHLGEHRARIQTGIESGFIGFSRENKGFKFLQIVIDSFVTKDFRRFDRWDDGYVFRRLWEEHPEIPSKDVVGKHPLKPYAHVVRYGAFAKYLEHEKGCHTRKHGLFERPI
tara:strand:+ start:1312 stop:2148 length:837 start_codon:yes stop_codon:yes gene_type:complete